MRIETNEEGDIVLKEVFSGVSLQTEAGNGMGICMRDDTFEFSVWTHKGDTADYRVNMKTLQVNSQPREERKDGFTAQMRTALEELELAPHAEILDVAGDADLAMTMMKSRIEELEKQKDGAYTERNALVAALSKVFPASLERHPDSEEWDDDWRWIVYIDLPTGQVSWHLHNSELSAFDHLLAFQGRSWDGHTTEEKYLRLERLPNKTQKDAEAAVPLLKALKYMETAGYKGCTCMELNEDRKRCIEAHPEDNSEWCFGCIAHRALEDYRKTQTTEE